MGGIMDYKARFYSPSINRFLQPDTLIPGVANPQNWNRFGYVLNNPIQLNDPTGHVCSDPDDPTPSCESGNPYPNNTTPLPTGTSGCNNDPDCELSNGDNEEEYSDVWVDTTLSPEEVTVLFAEIAWWKNALQLGNIGLSASQVLLGGGVLSILLMLMAPLTPLGPAGFIAGVGLFYLSGLTNNTLVDLLTLENNLSVASGAYYQIDSNGNVTDTLIATKAVTLTAGSNTFDWGVTVNGKKAIDHFKLPGYLQPFANLTELFNPQGMDEWIQVESWWHGFGN